MSATEDGEDLQLEESKYKFLHLELSCKTTPFESGGGGFATFLRFVSGFPPSLSPLLQELVELRAVSVVGSVVGTEEEEEAGGGFVITSCVKGT